METIVYISQHVIKLEDIRDIAITKDVEHQLFMLDPPNQKSKQLNLLYGWADIAKKILIWCYWNDVLIDELWFEFEKDREALLSLKPQSLFVIEHHVNVLPYLAEFLAEVMKKYGGWVDIDGHFSTKILDSTTIHLLPDSY